MLLSLREDQNLTIHTVEMKSRLRSRHKQPTTPTAARRIRFEEEIEAAVAEVEDTEAIIRYVHVTIVANRATSLVSVVLTS